MNTTNESAFRSVLKRDPQLYTVEIILRHNFLKRPPLIFNTVVDHSISGDWVILTGKHDIVCIPRDMILTVSIPRDVKTNDETTTIR